MLRSEKLFDRAQRVLPGGVNSPVRAFRAVDLCPRFIERADGPYIYDADGRKTFCGKYYMGRYVSYEARCL